VKECEASCDADEEGEAVRAWVSLEVGVYVSCMHVLGGCNKEDWGMTLIHVEEYETCQSSREINDPDERENIPMSNPLPDHHLPPNPL
jgi:hypothetical protein